MSSRKQNGSRPERTARVPIRTSPFWGHGTGRNVPQAAFLALPHLEALYGGAAGGGKSDALLMAALQYADQPNYSALLLRKTYPELSQPGGLMDRAHEWLQGQARWNETERVWTFASGAKLAFGYLQHSTDRFRYQGAEFDFIGFDELTHFDEVDYRYLFSRLRRREGSRIPPRMRGATNPGGRGHRWVRRRFIDKVPDPDDPTDSAEKCAARIFIPAKLTDNPGVDQEQYREALGMLDEQTRKQLEDGDWSAREPGNWVFDHLAIDAAEELGRRFDEDLAAGKMPPPVKGQMLSGTDYGDNHTVFEPIYPLERGGVYVPPGEVHTSRVDLEEIASRAVGVMGTFPYWWAEARYDSSFAQSNRTFAAIVRRELGETNVVKRTGGPNTLPVHFNREKDPAIRYLRLLFNRTRQWIESGKGDGTRVIAISPKARLLTEQLRGYIEDDFGKPEKGDDDAVDALISGVAPTARAHRATVDKQTDEAKRAAAKAKRKQLLPHQVA